MKTLTKNENKTPIFAKLLRIIIIVAASFMLVWSLCSRFTAGSIIGIIGFGGIVLCTLFYRQLFKLIKSLWGRVFGKVLLILAALVTAFALFLVSFYSVNMLCHINKPLESPNAVIVLGCRVRGETPSTMLYVRTLAAVQVLKEHPDAFCVVSGGQGDGEDISEAEAMRRILADCGISADRIIMEDKSTSTEENFRFSAEKLAEIGITDGIMIATSEFHQYRATLYAQRCGYTEIGNCSGGTVRYMLLNYWLREWAALFAMNFGITNG